MKNSQRFTLHIKDKRFALKTVLVYIKLFNCAFFIFKSLKTFNANMYQRLKQQQKT